MIKGLPVGQTGIIDIDYCKSIFKKNDLFKTVIKIIIREWEMPSIIQYIISGSHA